MSSALFKSTTAFVACAGCQCRNLVAPTLARRAAVTASPSLRQRASTLVRPPAAGLCIPAGRRSVAVCAMTLPKTNPPAGTQYEIWVKGSPENNELGDCPFSHRTMLTMEEKGIKYHKHLLDENDMPEWVKEVCEGQKQIPFVREVESDKWMYDSDKIIPYLEDKFPKRKLGKPDETPDVGSKLFPKFMEFLQSKPGQDEDQKKQALSDELKSIDEYLAKSGKPYIGGDDVCATDLRLAPQLKHVRIGVDEIKKWQVPTEYTHLLKWHDRMAERQSWKNTQYTEKYVRDGWNVKMEKMSQQ